MLNLTKRNKLDYDMAKMPEEFLKLEYPYYYSSVKRKYNDPMLYFS
ncbi:MAG: hypothetical protein QXR57_08405 [Metallosphaera sp.]|uniref:Uncharacterized protein n=1 Tax=Metallosphaera cuprina (strain Ar-4) TaxID=1006006 RepID=F4G2N3_METCR|nr:hypothetical protein [Metallosphaera cuprina]AEB95081.1 conserved hypothetical protein [Metallosphaera cuprina Ar-4]